MPSTIIASFQSGHRAILQSLDQIYQVVRAYPQAKPRLRELNSIVLAHLGRQNKQMLDQLQVHYHDNRQASKMLEFLIHDLKEIKIKYLVFFDKHSGEMADINARNFSRDFQEFSGELIHRLKMEEEYFFPLLVEVPLSKVSD